MNSLDLSQNDGVKLKACPYCGSSCVGLEDMGDGYFAVECEDCVAGGPSETSRDRAVSAWNRRHDETPSEYERLCACSG